MKAHRTALLTGLGGSLLLGSGATAELVDVISQEKDAIAFPNLYVINVYLQFDDPLDRGYAIGGTPNTPLDIHVDGTGVFYENAFGGVTAPNAAFIPLFPSLAFDSFVTINTKTTADGPPPTLSPGFPTGSNALLNGLAGTNLAWFVTPVDPLAIPDATGRVFVFQVSIDLNSNPAATGMSGTFYTQWDDGYGVTHQSSCWFDGYSGGGCSEIPAPGALALLGVAGLGVSRRRRR